MKPKHLLDEWRKIVNTVRTSPSLFVLLDFDGTLTPIVERPEDAHLPIETRNSLWALAYKPRFKVGVISGRMLDDVKKRVGLEELYYAGNHGLQISGPNLNFIHPEAEKLADNINILSVMLKSALSGVEGVIVENKGFTLSVHYRLTPTKKISWLEEKVLQNVSRFQQITVTRGKKVLEVKPAIDWNKGKAAKFLIERVAPGSIPLYAGDDNTDEDAFLQLREGITILVATSFDQTHAKYYLNNTNEIQTFLKRLANL